MIDRKTLGFLILLIAVMTAAAIWRLSLLPDWTQVTFPGPKGPHTKHGLFLLLIPACAMFMTVVALAGKWLVAGPDESIQGYQRRNRPILIGTGIILAVSQAFMISRSLWLGLNIDAELLARGTVMVSAILMMMRGNNLPKMPWIASRFPRRQLDAWQQARVKRFAGRLSVFYGLAMIAMAASLPVMTIVVAVFIISPTFLGLIAWYGLRLRRETPPLIQA